VAAVLGELLTRGRRHRSAKRKNQIRMAGGRGELAASSFAARSSQGWQRSGAKITARDGGGWLAHYLQCGAAKGSLRLRLRVVFRQRVVARGGRGDCVPGFSMV
jgi:hypothetical protein